MDIHVFEINSQGAASNTFSTNTLNIQGGICNQIYLAAHDTSVTTFELQLIDDHDNIIYDTVRREKTATGILDDEVNLPMMGIYTVKVYNASSDDLFTGRLLIMD